MCICTLKTSSQHGLVEPPHMVTRGLWYFCCSSALCTLVPMHSSVSCISSYFSTFWCFSPLDVEMTQKTCNVRQIFPRHPTWNGSHFFLSVFRTKQTKLCVCFGFLFNHNLNGYNSACLMFSLESTLHQWLFFQFWVPLNVPFALSLSSLL